VGEAPPGAENLSAFGCPTESADLPHRQPVLLIIRFFGCLIVIIVDCNSLFWKINMMMMMMMISVFCKLASQASHVKKLTRFAAISGKPKSIPWRRPKGHHNRGCICQSSSGEGESEFLGFDIRFVGTVPQLVYTYLVEGRSR